MPKIQFETNIPVILSLLSLDGEVVESKFGGNQIKFTSREGPFWVSEAVGSILEDQIRKKKIPAHIPVEVCRREMAQGNGRKGIHWTIDTVGFAPGEQPDGTFVVPANPPATSHQPPATSNGASGARPPAPSPAPLAQGLDNNGNGSAPVVGRVVPANGINGNGSNGHAAPAVDPWEAWAARIRQATQARLELYVDLCKWAAEKYGGAVSKQEVSSYLMNVLISCDKNGGSR